MSEEVERCRRKSPSRLLRRFVKRDNIEDFDARNKDRTEQDGDRRLPRLPNAYSRQNNCIVEQPNEPHAI